MIIFNYLWRVWYLALVSVMTIMMGVPIFIFSFRKGHYKYAYRFIRWWSYGIFFGMGLRYKLIKETKQTIALNQQYIVIANHTSVMDIMLTAILLPHHPICFVGKKELERIPIFGTIYKRICVTVDRKNPQSRAEVYTKCAERIAEGQSVVIYPEGGVPDPSIILDNFKNGAFSLSEQHNIPVLVFAFKGLKEMFPFDNGKGFPGCVKAYFLEILSPAPQEEMKQKAYKMIYDKVK